MFCFNSSSKTLFSSLHSISDQRKENGTQLDQGLNQLFFFFVMFLFWLWRIWVEWEVKIFQSWHLFLRFWFHSIMFHFERWKMVARILAASIGFLRYHSWKNSVFLRSYMHNLLFYSGYTNKIGFFYLRWNIKSKKKQGKKMIFLGSQPNSVTNKQMTLSSWILLSRLLYARNSLLLLVSFTGRRNYGPPFWFFWAK